MKNYFKAFFHKSSLASLNILYPDLPKWDSDKIDGVIYASGQRYAYDLPKEYIGVYRSLTKHKISNKFYYKNKIERFFAMRKAYSAYKNNAVYTFRG